MISWSDAGGVLFDLDGTLIDSMELHARAWEIALSKMGIGFDACSYYEMEGTNAWQLSAHFLGGDALEKDIEALAAEKDLIVLDLVGDTGFPIFPGADYLVDFLKQQSLLLGIVTAGSRSRVLNSLSKSFLSRFDTVICGDDGLKSKPDPEPYAVAFESLRTQKKGIAFENAPLGVQSAKMAGLFVIGVGSTCSRLSLENAGVDVYTPCLSQFVSDYL